MYYWSPLEWIIECMFYYKDANYFNRRSLRTLNWSLEASIVLNSYPKLTPLVNSSKRNPVFRHFFVYITTFVCLWLDVGIVPKSFNALTQLFSTFFNRFLPYKLQINRVLLQMELAMRRSCNLNFTVLPPRCCSFRDYLGKGGIMKLLSTRPHETQNAWNHNSGHSANSFL